MDLRDLRGLHLPTLPGLQLELLELAARRRGLLAGLWFQLSSLGVAVSLPLAEFRKIIEANVAALNQAVAEIPADRMRMHVCWGRPRPRITRHPARRHRRHRAHRQADGGSFPAANGRHEHEWKIWREVKLPPGKIIIPGVIDSTVNTVEHPDLVADRIVNFASVVARENVIAGVDCGFGTFAGRVQVDTKIVWMKLAALAEGAARASKQSWAGGVSAPPFRLRRRCAFAG